jgi:hypothetical protein
VDLRFEYWLLALAANIRLGLKWLRKASTLAYYIEVPKTMVKKVYCTCFRRRDICRERERKRERERER